MRIVFLGAPGSGKGTQSQRLAERRSIPQISTGDLLRAAVAKGTALGRRAKSVMDAGKLVDDATMLGIVSERLHEPDARRGFILDGFPRTIVQAKELSRLLDELGAPLDAVLLFEVPAEELMRRISGRRSCRDCGRVFNIHTSPPGSPPPCGDRCVAPVLVQRPDDNEATVAKRLAVYDEQTRPLIEHYRGLGLLRVIDADAKLDAVTRRVEAALAARKPGGR